MLSGSQKISLSGVKNTTPSKNISNVVKDLGETLCFYIIIFKGSLVSIIAGGKAYCFKDEWSRLQMTHWMSQQFAETIFFNKVKFT